MRGYKSLLNQFTELTEQIEGGVNKYKNYMKRYQEIINQQKIQITNLNNENRFLADTNKNYLGKI